MSQKIKIIGIKKLKNKDFYNLEIDVDDVKETLKISEDIIVKYMLSKDKELDEETYNCLKKDNELDSYFVKACNYISFQMRSLEEIKDYLKKQGANNIIIDKIVKKLLDIHLIDDEVLANGILHTICNQNKGINALENKLFQRKIKIKVDYNSELEEEIIDKNIDKNKDKNTQYPIKKQKELLMNKLLRDGFTPALVYSKINSLEFLDDSLKTFKKDFLKAKNKYIKLDDSEKQKKVLAYLLQRGYSYTQIKEGFLEE